MTRTSTLITAIACLTILAMTPPIAAQTVGGATRALPVQPQGKTTPPPSAPASATTSDIGYLTATMLADRCKRPDPVNSSYCFAYFAAVTDTVRAYEIWLTTREFCLPRKMSQADVRRTFMTYISAYPDRAAGQAASVVVNALKETYPCA